MNGRFDRFELIGWWDQRKLSRARVLVIGAGALGNEILKNLALLGIGNVFVVVLDKVENSNLSRSVLFRQTDNGQGKAEVASRSIRDIFPGVNAHAFAGNVEFDLGLGVFDWADVVIAGVDSRRARLAINRSCWKMGRTWVDGAIEQLSGVARVFMPPDGPCYECTLGHEDMKLISDRRSCNPLSKSDMVEGKVPTTPTAASIIAAVQCQEAVKVLHGLDALDGRGFTFNGLTNDSYVVSYQRRDDCTAHANYGDIRRLDVSTSGTTIAELLSIAKAELGEETVLEFNQEIVHVVECPTCQTRETVLRVLGKVDEDAGICKSCGEMRTPRLIHSVRGSEDFLGLTFSAVGVPTFDVIGGRNGHKQILLEFAGDASNALGPLHESWTNPVDTVSS